MVAQFFNKALTAIFGSRNERLLKGYRQRVREINALEPQMRLLTDAQMREKARELHTRLTRGESDQAVLPELHITVPF